MTPFCAKTVSVCLAFTLFVFTYANCTKKAIASDNTPNASLAERRFFVFPELREHPLKWYDSVSNEKIKGADESEVYVMNAQPNEFYVYQLGIWAGKSGLNNLQITFSNLEDKSNGVISSDKFTCFNTGGVDSYGHQFTKQLDAKPDRITPIWIGCDLDGVKPGSYSGTVSVSTGEPNAMTQVIPVTIKVSGEPAENHGYNEGKRLARLNWLNSTAGLDDNVTRGYIPVKVEGNKVRILGRTLTIAENGLPAAIDTFFTGANESLKKESEPIVNKPFQFVIELNDGSLIKLKPGKLTFDKSTSSRTSWHVLNTSEQCDLECQGAVEYDGFVDYKLMMTAKTPLEIKDIRLEIQVVEEKAEYMMGLNHEGGTRTPDWNWKWDVTKNQDMLWIGGVNGGLRIKWKAENYTRPLVNIYYAFGKLHLPPSWGNFGKGGVNVSKAVTGNNAENSRDANSNGVSSNSANSSEVVVCAYSGERKLKAGDVLHYDFELLVTPLKLIDQNIKYADRYFHGGGTDSGAKPQMAKNSGANILVIHHAEDIYPFINYPFIDENVEDIKELVNKAHEDNIRLKLYYTTRELTKELPEFWAFYSLNGEVLFPGPGNESRTEALHPNGPHPWLIENVRENYIPAWSNGIDRGKFKGATDVSVITTPDSRLNNFYVAGLEWMIKNLGIDGVYIDDSALDRVTLRRARKVIDANRPDGRMDLHSWNHFNSWAGYTNCLNLYMDLLPYFDLTWIGEGRDYNRQPDHWLIEVSGIPFGVTGQMLEGGGNPWRGMIYGITGRAGYAGKPESMWKFFDEHKFIGSRMIGYWEKETPFKSSNDFIKGTIYILPRNEAAVVIANWSPEEQTAEISVDWEKLFGSGFKPAPNVPAIENFQENQDSCDMKNIKIPGGKGLLIIVNDAPNACFR
ncbi:MAG: glycoside hydrolase domain-containing protein [Thermoguttaceae bacterium]